MSKDLEFIEELVEIRSPSITIGSLQLSDVADDDVGVAIQSKNGSRNDGKECHTPRSPQHMIPKILSCPPAPKKPRRAAPSCKRQLQFFEITAREEMESFFRMFDNVHAHNNNGAPKRSFTELYEAETLITYGSEAEHHPISQAAA
ncbi:hypothetical protein Leryth_020270 [Lithospermum erythrorhizon]|nr:hypothetical protein Leryth_020270 [Lithospermum erythrorhizon]